MPKLKLSGSVIQTVPVSISEPMPTDAPAPVVSAGPELEFLAKRAILVHAGEFICMDGSEIKFDSARLRRIVEINNEALTALAGEYGGLDRMPMGAHRPMLDMHDDSSSNDKIVGRLPNLLHYEELDIPGVGKMVPAVTTVIHFLGRETCKRVVDGRIYHLSVGIDEETDLIDEVSTVIVPAAPGAMLLSRGKKKLSKEERLHKMAKAKSRVKKLQSLKNKVVKLAAQLGDQKKGLQLAASQQKVLTRLSGLVSGRKMTPAEYKKQDIKKLSAMAPEALDAYLAAMDSREAVIDLGQRGSANASDFSEIAREMGSENMSSLRSETLGDFAKRGLKLKSGAPKDSKRNLSADLEAKALKRLSSMNENTAQVGGGARETESSSEKLESARQMSHMGLEGGEDVGKQLAAMQEQIDSLQTVLATVVDELQDIVKSEEAEAAELSAPEGEGEEAELSEGEKPGEKSELAEGEEKPGEKKEMGEGEEKPGDQKAMTEGEKPAAEGESKKMSEGEDAASKSEAKSEKEKESK